MGAWGYGYKDNDNYFNEAGSFAAPLVDGLVSAMAGEHDPQDLRARLMWTVNVLRGTKEEVVLSNSGMEVFHDAVLMVTNEAVEDAKSWTEPKKFLATVGKEMDSVDEWLDTVKEPGIIEDRLAHILDAVNREEDEG